jgi:alpha-galactosidase
LGYFVTESSEHFSEYVPWFIKRDRPDLIEKYNVPLDEYIRRCEVQIAGWEYTRQEIENPERQSDFIDQVERSHEYGSLIIHSLETDVPRVVYGNVLNRGLIDNLPQGCCVEVPCLVDRSGSATHRTHRRTVGTYTCINVQGLAVRLPTLKKAHLPCAMLDPHTAAELDLEQIWSLVDDLLEAHEGWLPRYH